MHKDNIQSLLVDFGCAVDALTIVHWTYWDQCTHGGLWTRPSVHLVVSTEFFSKANSRSKFANRRTVCNLLAVFF